MDEIACPVHLIRPLDLEYFRNSGMGQPWGKVLTADAAIANAPIGLFPTPGFVGVTDL